MDHVLNWAGPSLSLKGPSVTMENNTMLGHGGYFLLLLPFIFLILTVSMRYFQSGKKKWYTVLGILFLFTNVAQGSDCPA